jgi:hypothetical protein
MCLNNVFYTKAKGRNLEIWPVNQLIWVPIRLKLSQQKAE